MKIRKIQILFDEEQYKMLVEKTRETGFLSKCEYIRYILFVNMSFKDKIDQIYDKIIKDDK
ncbi:MAG: hypothetical protein V1663_04105 [archaeon]